MDVLPLHFQDLDFRHTFAPVRGRDGTVSLRWTPFGMPRIRQAVPFASFYLYGRGRTGALEGPLGTGVFVSREATDKRQGAHLYAVTAYHVAVSGGASTLRINVQHGPGLFGHRFLEREPDQWSFIPGGDDIAVLDVTDDIQKSNGDFAYRAPEKDFVSRDFMQQVSLGPGEDAFMAGLFVHSPGEYFNVPAVRFGNISQIAGLHTPVIQGNDVSRPSHIFDMHSRPGFSGSPVWVYRTPANALTGINEDGSWDLPTENNVFLKLLGIHSGQFHEDAAVAGGGTVDIPSSMTVVVPAWAISEALDLPALQEQREMREKNRLKSGAPKVRAEKVQSEPESDNPSHKEDFMSLLDAAAKEKK